MRNRTESFFSTGMAGPSSPLTSAPTVSPSSASSSSSRCNSPSTVSSDGTLTSESDPFSKEATNSIDGFYEEDTYDNGKAGSRLQRLANRMPLAGQAYSRARSQVQRIRDTQGSGAAATLVAVYFSLNLALTFYNKTLLNSFPYPYLITAIHAGSGVVGCYYVRQYQSASGQPDAPVLQRSEHPNGKQPRIEDIESGNGDISQPQGRLQALRTTTTQQAIILAYSALYAANIAVSNASLSLVSVPFHQIIRSTCPLFTAALGFFLLARRPARSTLLPLLPVVAGAALSCYGEMSFTSTGFLLTLLGTALAALKTVTTNLLQGGGRGKATKQAGQTASDEEKVLRTSSPASSSSSISTALCYSPIELLALMSPLACAQCLFVSAWTGELRRAAANFVLLNGDMQPMLNMRLILVLFGNGAMAFALNYVSFKTNKAAGPLAMTVVGNLKQVCTIVLAVWLYGVSLGAVNAMGIIVALAGTAWYGHEAFKLKQSRT